MNITIRSAQLSAHDLALDDIITFQELRIDGANIAFDARPEGSIQLADARVTLIVTEVALNAFLAQQPIGSIRGLDIKTLSGQVRILGTYTRAAIPVPFTLVAVPQIEGGARIRLEPGRLDISVIPAPAPLTRVIVKRINDELARAIDITRLPIPLRLTGITVEPGRILLSAVGTLDLHPGNGEMVPVDAVPAP